MKIQIVREFPTASSQSQPSCFSIDRADCMGKPPHFLFTLHKIALFSMISSRSLGTNRLCNEW